MRAVARSDRDDSGRITLPAPQRPLTRDRGGELPCEVWWATVGRVSWSRLVRWLDGAERARLSALRREEDRERFVLAATLARALVSSRLDVALGDVRLDRRCPRCGAPHGKPRVAVPRAGLELSITHSGSLVGVALAPGVAVGVDVEQVTDDRDVLSIAPSVLTDEELAALDRSRPSRRTACLLRLWARKEALTKMVGSGLDVPFTDIRVSGADDAARLLGWAGGGPPVDEVSLIDLTPPASAHVAAIAVLSARARVTAHDGLSLLAGL